MGSGLGGGFITTDFVSVHGDGRGGGGGERCFEDLAKCFSEALPSFEHTDTFAGIPISYAHDSCLYISCLYLHEAYCGVPMSYLLCLVRYRHEI